MKKASFSGIQKCKKSLQVFGLAQTCDSVGVKAMLISFRVLINLATGCLHMSVKSCSGQAIWGWKKTVGKVKTNLF